MQNDIATPRLSRRGLLLALSLLPLAAVAKKNTTVEVWKTATCGCCKDWIKHLQANGFSVNAHDVDDTTVFSRRYGVPEEYGSCHTAMVDGYVLEGHVPAKEILRLLRDRPSAVGLTVPGMPLGSPGMDGPEYAGRKSPYDVLLIQKGGRTSVYQAYR